MKTAEPSAITAGFAAAVQAIVLFADLDLNADAQSAIVVVCTLVAGLFIRSKVTPVA